MYVHVSNSRIGILVLPAFQVKGKAMMMMMPHQQQQLPHPRRLMSSPLSQYLSLAAKGVCDTTLAASAPLFPSDRNVCSSSHSPYATESGTSSRITGWQERLEERGGKLESICQWLRVAVFGGPFGFCVEFPDLCLLPSFPA